MKYEMQQRQPRHFNARRWADRTNPPRVLFSPLSPRIEIRLASFVLTDSRSLPRGVLIAALLLVAFNLLDAFLTLWHVAAGAVELNPLMRFLQEQGSLVFVAGKHFLVGACVVGVAAQSRRRLVFVALRFLLLPVYAGIVVYQVALFAAA